MVNDSFIIGLREIATMSIYVNKMVILVFDNCLLSTLQVLSIFQFM